MRENRRELRKRRAWPRNHHAEEDAHRRERDDETVQAGADDQHAVDGAEQGAEGERADDRDGERRARPLSSQPKPSPRRRRSRRPKDSARR